MTSIFLPFAIAAVCTYFALIRQFNLLSIGASIGWIALWAAIKEYPPLDVVEGGSAHTIVLLACIVMAVTVPLISLGRTITRARDQSGNFSVSSSHLRFPKLSNLFGGEDDEGEDEFGRRKKKDKEEELYEYKMRVRGALRNEGGGRKRR